MFMNIKKYLIHSLIFIFIFSNNLNLIQAQNTQAPQETEYEKFADDIIECRKNFKKEDLKFTQQFSTGKNFKNSPNLQSIGDIGTTNQIMSYVDNYVDGKYDSTYVYTYIKCPDIVNNDSNKQVFTFTPVAEGDQVFNGGYTEKETISGGGFGNPSTIEKEAVRNPNRIDPFAGLTPGVFWCK